MSEGLMYCRLSEDRGMLFIAGSVIVTEELPRAESGFCPMRFLVVLEDGSDGYEFYQCENDDGCSGVHSFYGEEWVEVLLRDKLMMFVRREGLPIDD